MELPIFGPEPDVPLCQTADGSCGACCGLYNFKDRSDDAHRRRLRRRTDLVKAAWPDVDALRDAKDVLMQEERDDVLFATVRVCPYAGYVDEPADAPARVGCLLHPLRHPDGADLRDLGVYPKEVCGGHFCANHEWLRPRERAFAATGAIDHEEDRLAGGHGHRDGLVLTGGRLAADGTTCRRRRRTTIERVEHRIESSLGHHPERVGPRLGVLFRRPGCGVLKSHLRGFLTLPVMSMCRVRIRSG